MKDKYFDIISKNIFLISVAIIVVFWIMESIIHTFVFKSGTLFSNILTLEPNELWMRLFITGIFILFGYFSQFLISERLKFFEALRESETQFREFVEGTDNLVTQVDSEGNFTYVNHMSREILGLGPKECLGLSAFSFVHPDDREHTIRSFEKWIKNKVKLINFENRQINRTGEINEMLWICNSHFDENGNIKYINSIAVNISKRKKFEEELRKAHDQLQISINSMADAYIIWDTKLGVTEWNRAAEKIFGFSKEEMLGKNAVDYIVPEEVRPLATEVMDKLLSGIEADYSADGNCIRKDGEIISCRWKNTPLIDKDGNVIGILSVAQDLTEQIKAEDERKTLEQHLYHAQKMEAVGTLAAGIAHDFNNIIASILLNTEMMLMFMEEDDSYRENADEILKSSNRAANLVEQMLTFSRQTDSEKKPIHLTPIVKEVLKFLRSSMPTTINITQNITAKNDIIIGDPNQIHQLIMNLCGNSEHAMRDKGGSLSVEMDNIELDKKACKGFSDIGPGEYISLIVRDTGHGIRKSEIKRVIEPFYTTKAVGEGTGLGLSVVHGIVKEYGGDIQIESKLKKGTTVKILFPVTIDNPTESHKLSTNILKGNERILLIDDEESIVSTLNKFLVKLGYSVNAKTNSPEALSDFRNDPGNYDIIITDLTMPELTGLDLSKEIHEIRPDMPIILITGYEDLIPQKKARELGIQTILQKPLTIEKLTLSIRSLLDT